MLSKSFYNESDLLFLVHHWGRLTSDLRGVWLQALNPVWNGSDSSWFQLAFARLALSILLPRFFSHPWCTTLGTGSPFGPSWPPPGSVELGPAALEANGGEAAAPTMTGEVLRWIPTEIIPSLKLGTYPVIIDTKPFWNPLELVTCNLLKNPFLRPLKNWCIILQLYSDLT